MFNFKNIAIIGRVPLPYGGVSVHLERLLARLRSESIEYDFYDLGGKANPKLHIFPGKSRLIWLAWFLLRARSRYKLIHFHVSNPYALIAADILMMGSGVRLAYSLHGEGLFRWSTKTGPWFLRWMLRKALRGADHLFPINPMVAQRLPDLGVNPSRITWMAAYLPPTEEEMDPKHISPEACDFFEAHSPVIGMQAWFGAFHDGQDIYGLEHAVSLLLGLRHKFPDVGLCTVISGTLCPTHRQHIFEMRAAAGLENEWLILEGGAPAVALFRRCELFLRPTISDGDSLSIRECLSFGVPVVASDAVIRPDRCRLFPTGDADAMVKTALAVLNAVHDRNRNDIKFEEPDFALPLMNYYRESLKNHY
jgi:glycosyltransferase involved in cell wall biosynthesis